MAERFKLDDPAESKGVIRARSQGETRYLTGRETARERMLRVVQNVQKRKKTDANLRNHRSTGSR